MSVSITTPPTAFPVPMEPAKLRLGRAYHIIDIENLAHPGCGRLTPEAVKMAWARYLAHVSIQPGDAVVVGCCAATAPAVAFQTPREFRLLIGGRGPDAADLVLLEDLDVSFVADRYQCAVIASGDGIFAAAAVALKSRGLRVYSVATRQRRHSKRLRLVADQTLYIDAMANIIPAA